MLTRPGKFHEIPWASEILHQLIGGKLQPHLVGLKGQSQVLCLRPLGRAQKNLGGVIDLYWIRWPESVSNIVVIITYIYSFSYYLPPRASVDVQWIPWTCKSAQGSLYLLWNEWRPPWESSMAGKSSLHRWFSPLKKNIRMFNCHDWLPKGAVYW